MLKKDPQEEPLSWLVPLLTDRWPDVRRIGLSLCASLASSKEGRRVIEETGKKFVGGLWSFALATLLDDMECGFVRQQVCRSSLLTLFYMETVSLKTREMAFPSW